MERLGNKNEKLVAMSIKVKKIELKGNSREKWAV